VNKQYVLWIETSVPLPNYQHTFTFRPRDHWIHNVWFPIGGPLKTSLYLTMLVAEILYVKHLAKHIYIENALIPIFVLRDEIGDYSILQLCAYSRSLGTPFELLNTTIGTPAFSLQF